MAVYPGFQGQKLIPKVLTKNKNFKKQHPDIFVSIDGATNEKTLPRIFKTGVDAIGPGSAVFHNERTPLENVKRFKKLIKNLTKPN
jgi:ribulose-phosphate 3-epimerase